VEIFSKWKTSKKKNPLNAFHETHNKLHHAGCYLSEILFFEKRYHSAVEENGTIEEWR